MAGKIYKLFYGKGHSRWFTLPKAERNELMKRNDEVLGKAGGRLLVCSSAWAHEDLPYS